jgi:predicted RNase H-like nuclease (RuvC/YqgF family)
MKRVGRPVKKTTEGDSEKTIKNREAQRRWRERTGVAINGVVNDLDNCETERKVLRENVKSLNTLLAKATSQVDTLMKDFKDNLDKKKPLTKAEIKAGSTIVSNLKLKLARNKMAKGRWESQNPLVPYPYY